MSVDLSRARGGWRVGKEECSGTGYWLSVLGLGIVRVAVVESFEMFLELEWGVELENFSLIRSRLGFEVTYIFQWDKRWT